MSSIIQISSISGKFFFMLKVFFYRSGPKARQPAPAFHSNKLKNSIQLNNSKHNSKQFNDTSPPYTP